uniref:CSON010281 protein n=1 Tax=Culicoides sonorensis TaxID=179676 RepID=A0A336LHV9_CULSO
MNQITKILLLLFVTIGFVKSTPLSFHDLQNSVNVGTNLLSDVSDNALDLLGEMTRNEENSVSLATSRRLFEKPLCPDSVLEFNGRDDVMFVLYNKKYPYGVDISKNLGDNMLIKNAPIKFVIHGFLNGLNSDMCTTVKDAFMKRTEDYNVIVVDWSKGSGTWLSNYFVCLITSRIVPIVGESVADFIVDMINKQDVNILYVNLIGHSLGAQISGIAGKRLIARGHKLPIIVGLDPALPSFGKLSESERLCPTDAEYVEVIHSNSGELGFKEPIGTADFYPNFGQIIDSRMPGCVTATCSHAMSFKYFAESVLTPFAFVSYKCSSYSALLRGNCKLGTSTTSYMGGNDMRIGKLPGIFVLKTNMFEPYGRSMKY